MKNLSKRQKNNIIIGGLCAVLVLMGIGYAAFSTQLRINGTSNISSTWDVRITGIESELHGATNEVEPTYDKTNGLTASFSTNLTSPGDYAIYTVEVSNLGSIDATLSSIDVNKGSNDAIVFETSGIKQGDNLLKSTKDELIVKVSYSDSVTSQPANTTSKITVTLNYEQATGGNLPEDPSTTNTKTIYSWNTNQITVGTSTITDLQSTKTAKPYYESAEEVMSASGYTFFNKYTVVDDVITEGYACHTFGVLSTPECVQGGSSEYFENNNLIFNTLDSNSTFTGAGGSCDFSSSSSYCYVGDFNLYANSFGYVSAYVREAYASCDVFANGIVHCSE